LEEKLRENHIQTVIVTGVATDYCSGQTAQEAVAGGFKTYFAIDATAPINQEAGEAMLEALQKL